jgi:hypothetical protein
MLKVKAVNIFKYQPKLDKGLTKYLQAYQNKYVKLEG